MPLASLSRHHAAIAQLEEMSLSYVVRALQQLGFKWVRGARFSTEQLLVQLRIIKPYHRLCTRLLGMLASQVCYRKEAVSVIKEPKKSAWRR